jgi:hypothetical protein
MMNATIPLAVTAAALIFVTGLWLVAKGQLTVAWDDAAEHRDTAERQSEQINDLIERNDVLNVKNRVLTDELIAYRNAERHRAEQRRLAGAKGREAQRLAREAKGG